MYNELLVKSYFNDLGIKAVYRVWYATTETKSFIPVDGINQDHDKIPDKLYNLDSSFQHFIIGNRTYLYFLFPDNYKMVVSLQEPVTFKINNLQMLFHLLYPCYTNYALYLSEKNGKFKLDKVIESIGQTTSSLDLGNLFSNILSNTLDVIGNADLGILWQYDPKVNRIVCKASVGNLLKGIENMQFEIGEGPVGHTFKMGHPILFQDPAELDDKEFGDISPENNQYWIPKYYIIDKIKSILTCPIIVDGRTECVMLLGQVNTKEPLTEQDIHLIQGFSSQVGIAIKNARQYTDIKNLNQILVKRDDIHSTLTDLSLQNMGARKVIDEISRMISKPIIFVDLLENEYIPAVKNLPEMLSFSELLNLTDTRSEKKYYNLMENGQLTHYVYPIRTGVITIGCLIIKAISPLGQLDQMALEQGNSVLALELIKKQHIVEFYYKNKRELFSSLLLTKDPTVLLQKATELGIIQNSELAVVVFQFSNYTDSQVLDASIHRLITHIKSNFSPLIQTVFGYHNKVTLLVSMCNLTEKDTFLDQLNRLVKEWTISGVDITCGMGSFYEGIHLIEESHKEAKIALSNLITRRINGFVQYSDIGINRLFTNQNTEEISKFLVEVFDPLRDSDDSNSLEETLVTYFKANRSATRTASKLHIHINTFYQRLKRIENSLEISFKDPEDVLHLQLACYLRESFQIVND